MYDFLPEQTDDIRLELEKMQFTDIGRILSLMDNLDDPNDPTVKACLFAEVPIPESFIADIFFVVREKSDGHWFIEAALAWIQMPTSRTEQGLIDVQKTYFSTHEPLPLVPQIIQDLRLLVQYEEMVEYFFIKNNLDTNLARSGFHNAADLLRSARHSDGITYLETSEQIGGEGPHAEDSIHFEFVVMVDRAMGGAHLAIIKAFLETHSPDASEIKEQTETAFYPLNNQFHRKEDMIKEILSQLPLDKNHYKAPVKSLFTHLPLAGRSKKIG